MVVAIMTDHPLKRWRRKHNLTQAQVAERCDVRANTVARWERGEQIPRGEYLDRLLDLTGLPTDAVIRPERFLAEHPDFLQEDRPNA
jgi:transcriptional regulator with XRE-family HTH domain